jgi:hypothetical protein
MALTSNLFSGEPRLEACLVSPSAHITPGSVGEFVGRIQKAIMVMGLGVIGTDEIAAQRYGPTTAAAVLGYKQARRIINFSYQKVADNIVGKMTIFQLDQEMANFENRAQPPIFVPQPPTPVQAEPVSTRFSMRAALRFDGLVVHEEPPDGSNLTVLTAPNVPGSYQVFDVFNNRAALYRFSLLHRQRFDLPPGFFLDLVPPAFYHRSPRQFSVPFPQPLSGLNCKGRYFTHTEATGSRNSRLELTLGGVTISVPMFLHNDNGLPSSGSQTMVEEGEFKFAKFGLDII